MSQVKEWIEKTEGRIKEIESEISQIDDRGLRHERLLQYLVKRDTEITAKYEDFQNRLRRNNIRIYQVPEGSEANDTKEFVKELLTKTQVSPQLDIKIERAHRPLMAKLRDPSACVLRQRLSLKVMILLWLALPALSAMLPESDSYTSLPIQHREQVDVIRPAGELEVLCSPLHVNRELFRLILLCILYSLTNVLSSYITKDRSLFETSPTQNRTNI